MQILLSTLLQIKVYNNNHWIYEHLLLGISVNKIKLEVATASTIVLYMLIELDGDDQDNA